MAVDLKHPRNSTENVSGGKGRISSKTAVNLYTSMVGIRRSQEALIEEYHPADEMRCPVHFCIGQEGPAAAVGIALNKWDYLFSGHRSHGFYLAKGGSLNGLFAELYGKATGSNRGLAGSMEICDEDANFYSGTILAGIMPIAAGAALASQMRGENRVTVTCLGDGSADEGLVYETLNFAALKNLPMIFVCENNQYSAFSRQEARQGLCDLAGRAKSFGVTSKRMNGNNVLAVYRTMQGAINRARAGGGPMFIELDTYRWCGHVGPEYDDDFEYRAMEELDQWKDQCPIEKLLESPLGKRALTKTKTAQIESVIKSEIDAAFSFAKSSPFPNSDQLFNNVLSDQPQGAIIPVMDRLNSTFDFLQPEAIPKPY